MKRPLLYSIGYSPWSLRARWALAHHGVEHDRKMYLPMITTPELRWRLKDFTSKVTVPVLFVPGREPLRDSTQIARWTEEVGSGAPLFADEEAATVWTQVADEIAEAGRVLATYATLESGEARRDQIPPFVPSALRGLAGPLVDLGANYLAKKYAFDEAGIDEAKRRMRAALERVGTRVEVEPFLGEKFGWGDIAVATALQFVEPHPQLFRFTPQTHAVWTQDELADDFRDVLDWRDGIVARKP